MSFDKLKALLEAEPLDAEQPMPASVRRSVVLAVDDDPGIRESLDLVLSGKYEVILCASAREGVAKFNDSVSAVILDVKMAPEDGFWTCDELRKLQPDIPIIFYSAYQDVKDPFRIINEHRPFGYINKDSDPKVLLDTLEAATRLYQTTQRSKRMLEKLQRRKVTA